MKLDLNFFGKEIKPKRMMKKLIGKIVTDFSKFPNFEIPYRKI